MYCNLFIYTYPPFCSHSLILNMDFKFSQQSHKLPVITGVITPISRVKSPQLPIYFRPFIVVISPFVNGKGPPCKNSDQYTPMYSRMVSFLPGTFELSQRLKIIPEIMGTIPNEGMLRLPNEGKHHD